MDASTKPTATASDPSASRHATADASTLLNLPNQLTIARLVLSVVLFVLIALDYYLVGLFLFIIAASTDWLDGYFARKYGMVTVLGRIMDPFADKLIICGTFIFLAANPQSGIAPWMVVVVVGRELLVTTIRAFFEQQGIDFSAVWSGKVKMFLQCIAAGVSLGYLALYGDSSEPPQWAHWVLAGWVWAAVISTIYSGVGYIQKAVQMTQR
ncbi:MAG: CDP-diacylglycerol--glycerol-3-phosphate 3-phosphatidyltransferase [Planctomycetales bacterium]|nr:CDP-diacylglycerol--glycerol-3-phosphate 3-phosphatidyltransferase [Planctomycetales bacterium]